MLLNCSDSSKNILVKVKIALDKQDASLVSLKILSKELKELHSFCSQQSAYLEWSVPPFPCSLEMLADLKEKILVEIETDT